MKLAGPTLLVSMLLSGCIGLDYTNVPIDQPSAGSTGGDTTPAEGGDSTPEAGDSGAPPSGSTGDSGYMADTGEHEEEDDDDDEEDNDD